MNHVLIDADLCNLCGICVALCPMRVLRMDEQGKVPIPVADFEEFCIRCGHCVSVCPTAALSLSWLSPEDCVSLKNDLRVTPGQAEQLLNGRRSIRNFKKKTIPREVLEKLLETACHAPSAKNVQPWHWIVIESPDEVQRVAALVIDWIRSLARENPDRGLLHALSIWDSGVDRICRGAPHLIIAHADENWGYGPEDCALALGHLDLHATAMNLGTCWAGNVYRAVNAYPPLAQAIGVPQGHRAFGALMLGYPQYRHHRIPPRNKPRIEWR
ncbi:MAG: nitroreductase family protein [Syntrophales bacterium]|nr:nitroreductase family protein [Syntrophales bacterium]MDX9921994.1 nitroreductase family protein [Syntrophales bacterium]